MRKMLPGRFKISKFGGEKATKTGEKAKNVAGRFKISKFGVEKATKTAEKAKIVAAASAKRQF